MDVPSINSWLLRKNTCASRKIGEEIILRLYKKCLVPTIRTAISELQYMVSTGKVLLIKEYFPGNYRLKDAVMISFVAQACEEVLGYFQSDQNKLLASPQLIVTEICKVLWRRDELVLIVPDTSPTSAIVLRFPALRSYVPTTNKHHP